MLPWSKMTNSCHIWIFWAHLTCQNGTPLCIIWQHTIIYRVIEVQNICPAEVCPGAGCQWIASLYWDTVSRKQLLPFCLVSYLPDSCLVKIRLTEQTILACGCGQMVFRPHSSSQSSWWDVRWWPEYQSVHGKPAHVAWCLPTSGRLSGCTGSSKLVLEQEVDSSQLRLNTKCHLRPISIAAGFAKAPGGLEHKL